MALPYAEILRIISSAPNATELIAYAMRAARGDASAIAYLKSEGWAKLLDIIQPGSGMLGMEILANVKTAHRNLSGTFIEGEYRVLDDYPWTHFLSRLMRVPFGAHIILGPVGSGKTTLAKRLAQRYHEQHGYQVECVNMYQEDVPSFAVTITIDTLIKRMHKLKQYLDAQATSDDAPPPTDGGEMALVHTESLPPTGRVIIIDEAILAMGSNSMDPGRRAALQALSECRHLDWVVVYIGQMAGHMPLALLGQSIVWVKKPSGREASTDRDHPVVRDLWERAREGFADIRSSGYWSEPYNDPRAWAFLDCQSIAGGPGWEGMVPFNRVEDG